VGYPALQIADWSRDPAGFGLGWAHTNINFIHKPTPRSNFCLLAPTQFLKHTAPFGRVDPVGPGSGWTPINKIFIHKSTPRSNFCLLAPAQLFTLQGFLDGVTIGGTPGDKHLGSPPGSALSQVEMRSPCQISGWWLTHTHTHTHTHFHLYIGDSVNVIRSSLSLSYHIKQL
jgi:hypothetical protein